MTGAIIAQSPVFISIELPSSYHDVVAGENIWFVINVANLSTGESGNATFDFRILDSQGKERATKSVSAPLEKTIIGNISTPYNISEGTYLLQVTLNSSLGDSVDEAPFSVLKKPTPAIDVLDHSLFDIIVDIPENYRQVDPGGELLTSIKLVNVGSSGRIDVFLDLQILDPDNNVIINKRETVAVETQANFIRSFDIPDDAEPGPYKVYARITYADGEIADSEHSFTVTAKKGPGTRTYLYLAIAAMLVASLAVITIYRCAPSIQKMQVRARVRNIVRRRLKARK